MAVQPQKMTSGLIFGIDEEDYQSSENKGADQLRGAVITAQLICVFVFTYAQSRFSNDLAQLCFEILY